MHPSTIFGRSIRFQHLSTLQRSVALASVEMRVKGGEHTLSWMCNLAEEHRSKKRFYAKAKAEEAEAYREEERLIEALANPLNPTHTEKDFNQQS